MKKTILFFSIILCSATTIAQDSDKQIQLGVRGGVNFTTITGDDFESPKSRTSFYAGLVAESFISDRFSLQGEAFYSGQGFDIEETLLTPKAEFQIDYIQVPILAKIYLIEGLNIHAGPQFGFKINEEVDTDPTGDGGDFNTDQIKDFDFQLAAGAEFKLTNGFFIQARYTYGFSEIVEDTDAHNSVFSTGIGFMF
ncbi:opacity protein-like surface antigen [Aquimarina sp. MAR_2010_214]|uniref:porin family protein n=1 Tax=Aquimarina sp. MAR_2010_214 TaxID=1250026 RepID=UPI000C71173A|nr:porin family protein [Aquimarina sp. MAR_2010_214]PKV50202.1 opacity protein-like surface antigen [Aquimarina sp. MAR_2010_214]